MVHSTLFVARRVDSSDIMHRPSAGAAATVVTVHAQASMCHEHAGETVSTMTSFPPSVPGSAATRSATSVCTLDGYTLGMQAKSGPDTTELPVIMRYARVPNS